RSIIFNVLFYLNVVAHLIVMLPTFLMSRHAVIALAKSWSRSSQWLLRVICDVKVEWRGLEKIPAGGFIVASKHQSAWETFALDPQVFFTHLRETIETATARLIEQSEREVDQAAIVLAHRPEKADRTKVS